MPVAQIQATIDAIHAQQVDAEMGTNRYALLFEPGVYGSPAAAAAEGGLLHRDRRPGRLPGGRDDQRQDRGLQPLPRRGGTSNCLALVNFWRTLSNLSLHIDAAGQDGCRASANFWAVSQAVSMRRLDIRGGNLSLMDYCTAGPQFASGGFIADSTCRS